MDFGGPVWHASAAGIARDVSKEELRALTIKALEGVGDASLGEWDEWPGYAYHLKRRLTAAEQAAIGEAVDIRGTPEQERRWSAVKKFLPPGFKDHKD